MTTTTTTPTMMLSTSPNRDNGPLLIAQESGPVPSEPGGAYSTIDGATINDLGEIAFSATLAGSNAGSAIFLHTPDGTRALLKAGDAAANTPPYRKFLELDWARFTWQGVEGTFLLFRAELEGSSPSEGIFLWSPPNKVEIIAVTGAKSPRGSTFKSFSQPVITATSGHDTVNSFLAFTAVMEDGTKSLIQKSSQGRSEEMLVTGQKVEKKLIKDFVTSGMGAFAIGCIAEIRSKGKRKPFNEVMVVGPGYIANGGLLKEGTVFKGTGRVKRILAPPAIAFQVSFVSVEFENYVSAIVARDVFGSPGIVAQTGEPVLGMPDETIESFGPPVANARIPIPGPQAIVSTVEFSSGKSGLWAHIFRFAGAEAETRLLIIEDSALRSIVPLKVNNNGALLLRATTGEGTNAREGVYIMNGLFD